MSLFFLSVCHARSSHCDMLLTGSLFFFIILNISRQMSLLYHVSINMFDDMMVKLKPFVETSLSFIQSKKRNEHIRSVKKGDNISAQVQHNSESGHTIKLKDT